MAYVDYTHRITPNDIEVLRGREVFVFGSNLAGIHGLGAARTARILFGAKIGNGYGMQGSSYAIPTKNRKMETMSLSDIFLYVQQFVTEAAYMSEYTFLVTPIGCGLAGYSPLQIAPLFKEAVYLDNVHLPLGILAYPLPW